MEISKNMLEYICTSPSVCDMFLNYEDNKSYFNEASYEDYYKSIKNVIVSFFESDIDNNNFRMQQSRISLTDKLYDLFSKDDDFDICKDKIFNALRRYKDMINILVIEKSKPFWLNDLKMRNSALESAETVIKDIDKFFKKYNYEETILTKFKEYDDYINENKTMSKKSFKEFNELISSSAIDIPQKYIELYFKELLKNGYKTNYDAGYNISRSMISNLANEKGITCLFNVGKLDFAVGAYHDGIITISNAHLKSFTDNPKKNAEVYLGTLFHEFTHLVQDTNYRKDRIFSYSEIKMLEDHLIAETLDSKYGRNNYTNLSFELDARSMSKIMVYRFYKSLGLDVKNEFFSETIKKDILKSGTDKRKVTDYKMVSVDLLFDELIKEIIETHRGDYMQDIFAIYPVLNLMYTKDGRRYTTLELLKKREEIKNDISSSTKDTNINMIANINQIIYSRNLSFVNLVADYKELMLDKTLEIGEEKKKIKKRLYKKIKLNSTISSFKDLYLFINSLLNSDKTIDDDIDKIIKNGIEMTDYFYEIKNQLSNSTGYNESIVKKKAK